MDRELLAQIADHTQVLAADRRYNKVVRVPRPEYMTATGPRRQTASPEEVAAFFAARRGTVRVG